MLVRRSTPASPGQNPQQPTPKPHDQTTTIMISLSYANLMNRIGSDTSTGAVMPGLRLTKTLKRIQKVFSPPVEKPLDRYKSHFEQLRPHERRTGKSIKHKLQRCSPSFRPKRRENATDAGIELRSLDRHYKSLPSPQPTFDDIAVVCNVSEPLPTSAWNLGSEDNTLDVNESQSQHNLNVVIPIQPTIFDEQHLLQPTVSDVVNITASISTLVSPSSFYNYNIPSVATMIHVRRQPGSAPRPLSATVLFQNLSKATFSLCRSTGYWMFQPVVGAGGVWAVGPPLFLGPSPVVSPRVRPYSL